MTVMYEYHERTDSDDASAPSRRALGKFNNNHIMYSPLERLILFYLLFNLSASLLTHSLTHSTTTRTTKIHGRGHQYCHGCSQQNDAQYTSSNERQKIRN